MKIPCTLIASGLLLCVPLVAPTLAGPGGSYSRSSNSSGGKNASPSTGTNPNSSDDEAWNYEDRRGHSSSGFNGGFSPSRPSTLPNRPGRPTTLPSYPGKPTPVPGRPERPTTLPGRPGIPTTLPSFPERPVTVPGKPGRPTTLPSFPERPTQLPSFPGRPPQRPSYPGWPTQLPSFPNAGNRPSWNNNYFWAHRPHYHYGTWYHGDWNDRNRPSQYRPYAWSGWTWGNTKPTAIYVTAPWEFGYWSYLNPYYDWNSRVPSYLNYGQPITSSNIIYDNNGYVPQVLGGISRDQALRTFADARASFRVGNLAAAQQQVELALASIPGDTTLHEFRALVLFARGDYDSAAATLYAVLSSGPGWDWTTMIGLYPSLHVYTAQLRNLETRVRQNPRLASARFVLAYHYLAAGHIDAAAQLYREIILANPQDSLSAQLLSSLTDQPYNPHPHLPNLQPGNQTIDIRYLLGDWQATRVDGSRIRLIINRDGSYDWRYTAGGRDRQFRGNYLLNEGLLILQTNGQSAMAGDVFPISNNRFIFKLAGSDPTDPGLNFVR